MSVSRRVVTSGVRWSSASQFGRQGIQLVTTIILARLLVPSDFGLLSMATVVIGFLQLLKDLGTSAAVIQIEQLPEKLLSSVFWINVTFGLAAMLTLFMVAPVVAQVYQEPRMTPILRALSMTFPISGLSIMQQALLERGFAFQKLMKAEIIATAVGSLVGVGSALMKAGVWSLVYQSLAVVTLSTVLLWQLADWKPKMVFCWAEVKAISGYSLHLTGYNIFNYFARNADYFLIGRYLGAQDLGYYTLAYRIMMLPLEMISSIGSRVLFPAYSSLQEDDLAFRKIYLKVVGAIAIITFPMMMGLWGLTEPFILTVFGSQWIPTSLLLLILAPVGMVQSIGTTVGTIYQAKGRTDWMLKWGVGSGLLFIVAFLVGLRWGVVGVASSYAIACGILVYPNFAIPFRLIQLRLDELIGVLWRPLTASLVMLGVVVAMRFTVLRGAGEETILSILVPAGGLLYVATSWLVNRGTVKEVFRLAVGKEG